MFFITGGVIHITKGDSGVIEVNLNDPDGTPYEMTAGDSLTLTVRKDPEDADPPALSVTSSDNLLVITHANTAALAPGAYFSDIQFDGADGSVSTVFGLESNSYPNFYVFREVTR